MATVRKKLSKIEFQSQDIVQNFEHCKPDIILG